MTTNKEKELEPSAYLVHYKEITKSGRIISVVIASLEPREPFIDLSTEPDIIERQLISVENLYTAPKELGCEVSILRDALMYYTKQVKFDVSVAEQALSTTQATAEAYENRIKAEVDHPLYCLITFHRVIQ